MAWRRLLSWLLKIKYKIVLVSAMPPDWPWAPCWVPAAAGMSSWKDHTSCFIPSLTPFSIFRCS